MGMFISQLALCIEQNRCAYLPVYSVCVCVCMLTRLCVSSLVCQHPFMSCSLTLLSSFPKMTHFHQASTKAGLRHAALAPPHPTNTFIWTFHTLGPSACGTLWWCLPIGAQILSLHKRCLDNMLFALVHSPYSPNNHKSGSIMSTVACQKCSQGSLLF